MFPFIWRVGRVADYGTLLKSWACQSVPQVRILHSPFAARRYKVWRTFANNLWNLSCARVSEKDHLIDC